MPSESVTSFLDYARENRILPIDQVQELVRRSEVPQENVPALCDALVSRGLLTPYQAACIRSGRGKELSFAGYPVLDELGPCPGGIAYKVQHTSLRTPIVMRRLRPDWLVPADNLSAFIQRAQHASTIHQHHLTSLLDAGAYEDQLFVVLEPYEGATLESLVREIGPMPAFLACAFIRQAAIGLNAVHRAGMAHGDIRPDVLSVHPLVPSSRVRADGSTIHRPSPTSTITLCEFGLIPRRPSLIEWERSRSVTVGEWAFLPPERLNDGTATLAGDIYSLGQSLFFLLTGRTPYPANSTGEFLQMLANSDPIPLGLIRNDLAPELITLIQYMTARDPSQRPSVGTLIERLAVFQSPEHGTSPLPVPTVPKAADSNILGEEPVALEPAPPVVVNPPIPSDLVAQPIDLTTAPSANEWTVQPYLGSSHDGEEMFAPAAAGQSSHQDNPLHGFSVQTNAPIARRREMSKAEAQKQKRQWTLIAGGLWLLSIPLWIILLNTYGCFDSQKAEPDKPIKKRR